MPPKKKTGVRDHVSLQGRALNLALPIVFFGEGGAFQALNLVRKKEKSFILVPLKGFNWRRYTNTMGDDVCIEHPQLNNIPKIYIIGL